MRRWGGGDKRGDGKERHLHLLLLSPSLSPAPRTHSGLALRDPQAALQAAAQAGGVDPS